MTRGMVQEGGEEERRAGGRMQWVVYRPDCMRRCMGCWACHDEWIAASAAMHESYGMNRCMVFCTCNDAWVAAHTAIPRLLLPTNTSKQN
eukprot:358313-Chlamydomonas_euryale.AAC.8